MVNHVQVVNHVDASNGQKIGYINYSDSSVKFVNVSVPTTETYVVNVRYDNGSGANSSHTVSINGGSGFTLTYPPTVDWARFLWVQFNTTLNAGNNTIQFSYSGTYAELDSISVYMAGVAANGEFKVVNRNSGKYLEILNASTADGAQADQWGDTNNPTQIWSVVPVGTGYYKFVNKNSAKLMDISGASLVDGALAIQWHDNRGTNQQWSFNPTDTGYYKIPNRNSGKLLEIYQNSTANGANVDQWGDTGYPCQQWTLIKEGIR